jgi:hypothetical protein
VRSKRGINTLRKKKLSNKTAAQRCVWRFYTVTLKNSLNRRFLRVDALVNLLANTTVHRVCGCCPPVKLKKLWWLSCAAFCARLKW